MPPKQFVGRYISVYFDTREEKTFWEEKAMEHGTTLSKLVFEGLETLRTKIESKPRPDLLKENESLKEKIAKIEREIRLQANLIEKYESELYRVQHAGFKELTPTGEGTRSYDLNLIQLLKSSKKVLDSKTLLVSLKIDPGDLAATRLVRNQLEALQRYGLAKENSYGWTWIK
jgi:hypothetical protein